MTQPDDKKEPDVLVAIRDRYPELPLDDTKRLFLSQAYGKMPDYAKPLEARIVHNVKTATIGSFVICHGTDPDFTGHAAKSRGETYVAIIKRNDKGPNGEDRYGVLGGYTQLGSATTMGEQPKEGAVRELKEEAINNEGKPVIEPDPARLKLLVSGIDYRSPKLPTNYNGHALELTPDEFRALREHSERLEKEVAYKNAATEKSGGEVADLKIMPLSKVLAMSPESFTYRHEFDAIAALAEQLKQPQASVRRP